MLHHLTILAKRIRAKLFVTPKALSFAIKSLWFPPTEALGA